MPETIKKKIEVYSGLDIPGVVGIVKEKNPAGKEGTGKTSYEIGRRVKKKKTWKSWLEGTCVRQSWLDELKSDGIALAVVYLKNKKIKIIVK